MGYRLRIRIFSLLFAVNGYFATADVEAQEAENGERQQAKEFYEQGKDHFQAGRYTEALSLFKQAYNISGEAKLLFNLGACAEGLGETEKAIAYYELYLEEIPDAEDAAETRARVEALRNPVPKESPPIVLVPTDTKKQSSIEDKEPEIPSDTVEEQSQTTPLYAPPPEEETGKVFWPGVLLGIGGLVAASGAITAGIAYKKYEDLDRSCAPNCTADDIKTGESLAITSDVLFGVGGATMVAGAIIWIVDATKKKKEKNEPESAWCIVPAVLEGANAFVVQGRF